MELHHDKHHHAYVESLDAALASTHRLEIRSLPNQDSVVSAGTPTPLCSDVWEHAYYLTYRNRSPDYLAAWWSVVAWDVVDERLHDVTTGTLPL